MKKSTKIILTVVAIVAGLAIIGFSALVIGTARLGKNLSEVVGRPGMEMVATDFSGYGLEESSVKRAPSAIISETAVPPLEGYLADDEFVDTEQRIIKNGNISAKVDSAEESAGQITAIAQKYQGFVQSSNIYESETGAKSGSVVIRVPVDQFENAFAEIKGLANQVVSESVSGQDVTEQFIDLQSRLKNKIAEETQYLEILEQATDVEDILMVTERLSAVRAEIERLQGRLDYLENLTDMSTISTYLTEEDRIEIPVKKWRPIETIRNSFRTMIAGLQGVADLAIWIVMFAALIGLPLAVIIWLIVWLVKKFAVRKNKS